MSIFVTISAPADTDLIGPDGGEVYAGHNSSLIVPAGGLTTATMISAKSFEAVITSDDETVVAGLEKALMCLEAQAKYTERLPGRETITREWFKNETIKKDVQMQLKAIQNDAAIALQRHREKDDAEALLKIREALGKLTDLQAHLKNLLGNCNIGSVSYSTMIAYSNDEHFLLELVESLHYETLFFEFGPCGTEFVIPAELVIPFDEIFFSDGLFWYSGDGEVIDLIDMASGKSIVKQNGSRSTRSVDLKRIIFPTTMRGDSAH